MVLPYFSGAVVATALGGHRVMSVCSCSPRLVTLCHCLLLTYMGGSGSETGGFVFATVLFLVGDFPDPTLTAGMLIMLCTHDS